VLRRGIAPTIYNGHVGAILYGCPTFLKGADFVINKKQSFLKKCPNFQIGEGIIYQ